MGAALGGAALVGCTLLLYLAPGLLRTTGILVALTLLAAAAGAWVGGAPVSGSSRRRWVVLLLAYVSAGIYAVLWTTQPSLRQSGLGSAGAALLLLALPAYASGSLLPTLAGGHAAPAAGFGMGAGVAFAATVLIPALDADVIFFATATVLLVARLWYETAADSLPSETFRVTMTGKIVMVTGVGDPGQVGHALARAFRDAGARVIAVGFSDRIHETARKLGHEDMVVGARADLSNADEVGALFAGIANRFGALNAVVNAAGGLRVMKPVAETEPEEWRAEIQRNSETAFLVNRAALPLLRASRGCIVNFASPAGIRAKAQLGAYSAAKAGVIALTRTLALEEKAHGVRVNAIAPGLIDTADNREAMKDQDNVRWVTREQIADVVLFLCSDAGSGITGETVHVLGDGIE
ncbi:MAG TPA: SDR family NAD(P)-dependent oxidoreductase [Longimicrobiales bacterium]|nr:SDR family NAD(P)-dependent oxidoreductase [Longimicrobiales bacterium]